MRVETRVVNSVCLFTIHGDFTFNNLGEIRDTMKKDVAAASTAKFLVDLSNTAMIDSTGLGTIVAIYKTVLSRKGAFGVIVPNGEIKEVFVTLGLNKLFPIFESEKQAVRSV